MIDSPLDQAELVLANEQRARSPFLSNVSRFFSLCSSLGSTVAALDAGQLGTAMFEAANSVQGLSEILADDHTAYLLGIVIPEMRRLADEFASLSVEQRAFLNQDWLALMVDANRKARQTRCRERVRRIAQILCNAADAIPSPKPDYTEELLRIAMYLDNGDVVVLREAVRLQGKLIEPGRGKSAQWDAVQSWRRGKWDDLGVSEGEMDSICAKLQSFGLVVRMEEVQSQNVSTVVRNDWMLLQRGFDFVQAIKAKEARG